MARANTMMETHASSSATSLVDPQQVVLFVPNARDLLDPFLTRSSISSLSVSYLTHILSFCLPSLITASGNHEDHPKKQAVRLVNRVESVLQQAGFDVERVQVSGQILSSIQSASRAASSDRSPWHTNADERATRSDDQRAWMGQKTSWLSKLGFISSREKERVERRKRHVANCDECQAEDRAQMVGPVGESRQDEGQEIAVSVEKPLKPRILETIFSVEGMFCGSCVNTLTESLSTKPNIIRASVSLLSNSATVVYDSNILSTEAVAEIIEDTGYGVEIVESLQLETENAVRPLGIDAKVKAGVETEKGMAALDRIQEFEEHTLVSTFMVGGMTCSACSSTLSQLLSPNPLIKSHDISVLSASATITHSSLLSTENLIEIVDDAGYDCSLVSSIPLTMATVSSDNGSAARMSNPVEGPKLRTVTVLIEGMFCSQCVKKVNATLAELASSKCIVSFTPTTLKSPSSTIIYSPKPSFTIRQILSTLADLDSEFSSTLVRSVLVSSRARAIQRKEAKQLFTYFALALILAIPTFIVSIVGMVLMPKESAFRMFWMKKAWGGASRGTVILWVLATIVQFGIGKIFYRRAFRPIAARIRSARRRQSKGSTSQPVQVKTISWQTFFSFGSMDLLVAMSTTTAYFSSLAMMIVDITTPRQMKMIDGHMVESEERMMTLFDASVFLIFFILIGRVLEAYAKSRTGDAVALLGTLRPDSALLAIPKESSYRSLKGIDLSTDDGKPHTLSQVVSASTQDTAVATDEKPSTHSSLSFPEPASMGNISTLLIPASHLEIDDIILLQPGSLPPTDGVIVSGMTSFDESSLTGESKPVKKGPSDQIFTGTVNVGSAVLMKVEVLGDETMIEKIVRAVGEAQGMKSPVELLAERITGVFVPVVVYFAICVLVVWLALVLSNALPDNWIKQGLDVTVSVGDRVFFAFEFFIAVLVVACPCGIGLAAPTAAAVGLGLAAQKGVLVQGGGSAFQAATKVDTVIFDKTGTLTTGKPSVTGHDYPSPSMPSLLTTVSTSDGIDQKSHGISVLLSAIQQLEEQSSHPLATALRTFCSDQLVQYDTAYTVSAGSSEEIIGRGLKAVVTCDLPTTGTSRSPLRFEIAIGNEALMTQVMGKTYVQDETIRNWQQEAKSVVLVGIKHLSSENTRSDAHDGYTVCARFAIADPPRPEARDTIDALRGSGKDVWMLSGDNETTAKAVAKQVGIDETCVVAGVLPEQKAEHIRKLQGTISFTKGSGVDGHRFVLFAGDGLNDSVALAAADVGVAMGSGSQVSVVSADFVLLNSSLDSLNSLLHISQRVFSRTKLNFCWALVFNLIALPLAAGVFYAAGRTKLAPVWSALAMALSSVSVVSSSLALRWGI
ncbi:Cation transport ATPase [Phaffia rhodozyma]|uniref:Cation transport ATPase n=1 Tax=Phaffia rhodozyma TaxID=264483 RepID=A0A0F7SJP9_PHARH|nr:Cation transport ATPase [Phaffia rhodozyma]